MSRYLGAAIGSLLLAMIPITAALVALNHECSSDGLVKIERHAKPNGTNEDAKNSEAGDKSPAPHSKKADNPTGRFDLQITEANKIEGNYYAKAAEGEKENWWHKFICDTKIGEFAIAAFTFFLVFFYRWSLVRYLQALGSYRQKF